MSLRKLEQIDIAHNCSVQICQQLKLRQQIVSDWTFSMVNWQGSEDAETAQWAPCKCQQNRIQNCPEILSAGSIRSSDVSKSVSKYFVGAHFGADAGGRRTQ